MPSPDFTPQQRQAISSTGRSVIVSAAAGSGKTAVLAERCAYLVCDAPPGQRCDVGQLLVLTFTDAAAAEMRSRIVAAIRDRSQARPGDERLRDQVALVDTAQISTVHSFCLWLIRRWFSELGVDPSATVFDEEEARLLARDVLDAVFRDLYESSQDAGSDPLGADRLTGPNVQTSKRRNVETAENQNVETSEDQDTPSDASRFRRFDVSLRPAFVRLIDDYGLGDDREIARFVRRLAEFADSLPDPDRWLDDAVAALGQGAERVVAASVPELAMELSWQFEHAKRLAESIESGDPAGHFYSAQIRAYVEQLRDWERMLGPTDTVATGDGASLADGLARFETVRQAIAGFEFAKSRAPNLPKDADESARAARTAAAKKLGAIKDKDGLFHRRLRARFGLFSVEECIEGLRRTAPYAETIAALARRFRGAYAVRKREANGLTFADLERFAFSLLCHDGDIDRPTDIARSLHRRFAHVLVDEFQDINPIQQAIIRLASRECDPRAAGNLFVVGDVKQSIYRFRLAEPAIFTDRLHRFRALAAEGAAVTLQTNFRSRPEILEAVNALFRRLMPQGAGHVVYDAEAELRPGRVAEHSAARRPVEVHLLEKTWAAEPDSGGDEDDETVGDARGTEEALEYGSTNVSDPQRWIAIEREAYLIGSRIRAWISAGEPVADGRPMRFRDIAILLRAKRVNAERLAAMLSSMGLPAYADAGGSLLAAREIRDVVAALRLFDNFQQDIPLAAVLRSGILDEPLTPDELLEIRCLDRDVAFHEAVRAYAASGPDAALRARLSRLTTRVNRYRDAIRRRPLADVLWELYEHQGYLAYACGLPNGTQRRANLLKLHELARRFGTFRRQGLHRFLSFLDSLADDERELSVAPAIGEAEDVIRIMSIHQSKGLEFPVVFVANLGSRLNLGDRRGRMIFERESGIGLRVVDTREMIEYPSVAHGRVAAEIERTTREEELRVLYVAMTRARDRLILVGSDHNVGRLGVRDAAAGIPLTRLALATAATPLAWLSPVLSDAAGPFETHIHGAEEMAGWRVSDDSDESQLALRSAVARCDPLPPNEPLAPDEAEVERVTSRIEFVYPWLSAASVRSAVAASEVKGAFDLLDDRDDGWHGHAGVAMSSHVGADPATDDFTFTPSKYRAASANEAAHRGIVTHRVLQHLDFRAALNANGVALELQRLESAGLISRQERPLVDAEPLAWFVATPLAGAIRRAGEAYRREFLFISGEPVNCFDRSVVCAPDDRVLVRGIVDGILPAEDGIEVVDFKTDAVAADQARERGERYRPQMELYARAVSRMWRRPVTRCHLVFLSARMIVESAMPFVTA